MDVQTSLKFNGIVIESRSGDNYINATQMCKAGGKLFAEWTRLKNTQVIFSELSADMNIPISGLVDMKKGGNDKNCQGSWIHPDLAVQLAQWISPSFAIQVSRWIRELFFRGSVSVNDRRSDDELQRLTVEYEQKLREKDAQLLASRQKELRLSAFIKITTKLETNEILYIGTSDAYQRRNRFKVGGVALESALPGRFSTYNSGRPADDRFYCVRFWKVHSYSAVEKIVKTCLVHFKDKRNEDYHIHGDALVEALEFIVQHDGEAIEWINGRTETFAQQTIESEPCNFQPVVLKKRMTITAGEQQVDICDISNWSQDHIDSEITAIISIYKQRRELESLGGQSVHWKEVVEIIKERHQPRLIRPWRNLFKNNLSRYSEDLKLKGLGTI